jgi:hypothetical protein
MLKRKRSDIMTIQSYSVLKNLKRIANNSETELCLLGDTTLICTVCDYDNFYDYEKYKGEINGMLIGLEKAGFISFSDASRNFFFLTEEGIHPTQRICSKILNTLIFSVFLPIFVSAATTLFLFFVERWLVH